METHGYHGAAVELAAVDVIETSARLVYKVYNVWFCVHCLLCGSDDHRFNACPRRNNGGNNSGNNPGGLMNGNLTDGVGTNNQILSGGIGQGN